MGMAPHFPLRARALRGGWRVGAVLAAVLLRTLAAAAPLGAFWAEPLWGVSGASSGAAQAVQLAVAHAASVRGVGALAGNVYYCSLGSIATALAACVGRPEEVDLDAVLAATRAFAGDGRNDPVERIREQFVYILHGTEDATVAPGQSEVLEAFYREFGDAARIETMYTLEAAHTFPTDGYGNDCLVSRTPYLSDCRFDAAGEILRHVHTAAGNGSLAPPVAPVPANLIAFDQDEFGGLSMDETAFVYVPTACQAGAAGDAPCTVHVALHGCSQSRSFVGTVFVENAGYNAWAEANRIIVLYPQAASDVLLGNPNACWDW